MQSVRNFISNTIHTIGNFGAGTVVEKRHAEQIKQQAEEIFQIGQLVYGTATVLTILFVASAFFSLLNLAPFSLLFCVFLAVVSRDAQTASKKAMAIARHIYNYPYLYAYLSLSDRNANVLRDSFVDTVFLKHFVPLM